MIGFLWSNIPSRQSCYAIQKSGLGTVDFAASLNFQLSQNVPVTLTNAIQKCYKILNIVTDIRVLLIFPFKFQHLSQSVTVVMQD